MRTTRAHTPARARLAFSLLEVLIALAIFSIGMLALIPLFAQTSWGARGGKEISFATNLAQTYIDKARNSPFDTLPLCLATPCTPPAAEVTANSPYIVSWTVSWIDGTAYDPSTLVPVKRVTVTVACPTCARKTLKVQMTTLIAQRS